MSLSDIVQKIMDEANKKAAFMKQVADGEIKKIEEESAAAAELRKKQIDEKINVQSESIISKSKTLAKMNGRSQALKEKREVIDLAYEEVEAELNKLETHDYVKLMTQMIKHAMEFTEKGNLTVPADKRKQMEEALEKAKAEFHIKEETSAFKGGFVLQSGKVEVNLSFPYLVQNIVRPNTELEVAKILFS